MRLFRDLLQAIEGCFGKIGRCYTRDRLISRAVYILRGLYRLIKEAGADPGIISREYRDRNNSAKNCHA